MKIKIILLFPWTRYEQCRENVMQISVSEGFFFSLYTLVNLNVKPIFLTAQLNILKSVWYWFFSLRMSKVTLFNQMGVLGLQFIVGFISLFLLHVNLIMDLILYMFVPLFNCIIKVAFQFLSNIYLNSWIRDQIWWWVHWSWRCKGRGAAATWLADYSINQQV